MTLKNLALKKSVPTEAVRRSWWTLRTEDLFVRFAIKGGLKIKRKNQRATQMGKGRTRNFEFFSGIAFSNFHRIIVVKNLDSRGANIAIVLRGLGVMVVKVKR